MYFMNMSDLALVCRIKIAYVHRRGNTIPFTSTFASLDIRYAHSLAISPLGIIGVCFYRPRKDPGRGQMPSVSEPISLCPLYSNRAFQTYYPWAPRHPDLDIPPSRGRIRQFALMGTNMGRNRISSLCTYTNVPHFLSF